MLITSSINITLSEVEITIDDNKLYPQDILEDIVKSIFNKMSTLFDTRISKKDPLMLPEHPTRILGLKRVRYNSGNFILVLETDPFYIRLN